MERNPKIAIAGDIITDLGQNGSGKTSILRVLTQAEREISGTVEYSKDKLGGQNPPCLWSHPHIFNVSLRENLVFDQAVDDRTIFNMLESLQLMAFCDSLPKGLDTVMDMNNLSISDGERSRLVLARLLLNTADSPLLLLDEFSRNVNPEIEALMLDLILQKKSTVFAVTNNLATARCFDKILYISKENARLTEVAKDDMDQLIKRLKTF